MTANDLPRQKLHEYFTSIPEVELAYLFGSVAENRTGPMSDIDFAVLFNEKINASQMFKLQLQIIGGLIDLLRRDDIEVVILNQSGPAFAQEAIKNRQEIFVRSNLKRIEFEAKTMLSYFDRLFYIKRHTKISLAQL